MIFNVIRLQQNQGHGNARRIGIHHCSFDLVALMDADDISVPNRFELQLNCFRENKDLSVVGGWIKEFVGDIQNVTGIRALPAEHGDITNFLRKRCPFNQMTVMFKKSDVLSAGGYMDWFNNEDYYLWLRMYLQGMKFRNITKNLVFARTGVDMYKRRGGWKYFQSEARLQKYMLLQGVIGLVRFIYNVGIRFVVQVAAPNRVRGKIYKLIRKKVTERDASEGQWILQPSGNGADIPFSVSMCVYGKDNPEHFDQAIWSVINQTVQPDELVVVVDGPVSESIDDVIGKYKRLLSEPSAFVHTN